MERKSSFKGVRIDKAKWSIPLIIIVAYVAMGLIVEPLPKILEGLGIIYTSPSQLLTDYFASASMVAFMSLVIRATKTPFTGSMISSVILGSGVAFFGVNIFNIARSITDYFYEKEATRIIVDIKNEDEMGMKVLANIYLTQKEVDDLLYLMDQPSQPEKENYYSELLHTDGRPQLRLLGSLLDDFRISSSNEGTEFILIKNFPQEKNSN